MENTKTYKSGQKAIAGMILIIILGLFSVMDIRAASNAVVPLEAGKTYTDYDVTGDGVADKVRFVKRNRKITKNDKTPWRYIYLDIYVNDVRVLSTATSYGDVDLCIFDKSNVYFSVYTIEGDSGPQTHKLYQYKNRKWKMVFNVNKPFSKLKGRTKDSALAIRSRIHNISNNKIVVEYVSQLYTTAAIRWRVTYTLKNGKFVKQSSNTYQVVYPKDVGIKNKWTVVSRFKVYTKVGGKKVRFTTKRKEKVKINRIRIKKNTVYFEITRKNGRKGWIKNSNKAPWSGGKTFFKEARFVS